MCEDYFGWFDPLFEYVINLQKQPVFYSVVYK